METLNNNPVKLDLFFPHLPLNTQIHAMTRNTKMMIVCDQCMFVIL